MSIVLICVLATAIGGALGWILGPRGYGFVMPDSFSRTSYGYLTNQAGHMLLGFCMAFSAALAGVAFVQEPPDRLELLLVLFCAFGAFEIFLFGEPFDLFEDVAFTIFYGAGATVYGVRWVEGFNFKADLLAVVPFFAVASVHITLGALWRLWRNTKGGR